MTDQVAFGSEIKKRRVCVNVSERVFQARACSFGSSLSFLNQKHCSSLDYFRLKYVMMCFLVAGLRHGFNF